MCKILPRIQQIADNEGIKIGTIERAIGASKGVLSRAIANGTDIQSKWLQAIVEIYPQYSGEWLLTGKGDMLKPKRDAEGISGYQLSASQHKVINNKGIEQELEVDTSKTRPRIPLEAAAGSLSIVTQSVSQSDCDYLPLITRIPDYDFTIMVKGDSMKPDFLSGDEVACRMITERSFIQWGQPHVIDSYDGIVLKRIHDKGDKILCTSDNPAYGDFYIPKTDIYHLARVVGLIRQY